MLVFVRRSCWANDHAVICREQISRSCGYISMVKRLQTCNERVAALSIAPASKAGIGGRCGWEKMCQLVQHLVDVADLHAYCCQNRLGHLNAVNQITFTQHSSDDPHVVMLSLAATVPSTDLRTFSKLRSAAAEPYGESSGSSCFTAFPLRLDLEPPVGIAAAVTSV